MFSDWTVLEHRDKLHEMALLQFEAAFVLVLEALGQQPANSQANQPVGQPIALEQGIQKTRRFGGTDSDFSVCVRYWMGFNRRHSTRQLL